MEIITMDNKIISPSFPKLESDDEDFLQPASSPYNMSAKIEEANQALYAEDIAGNSKKYRVKFKEDLADFEPDLTDDDVQSIESYNEVEDIDEIGHEELKYIVNNRESMLSIDEEFDNEIVEEIEEVASDSDITPISPPKDLQIEPEIIMQHNDEKSNTPIRPTESVSQEDTCLTRYRRRPSPYKHIECKKHCIDQLESHLDLCIRKLQINEKPQCPTLKLQKRNCCTGNTCKVEQKLPNYSGLKSEYGLTQEQWIKREQTNDLVKLKREKRYEITQQYQRRKVEQNEQIFNEWLRNIRYKKQNVEPEQLKKYYIPFNYLLHPNNRCDNNNNNNIKSTERQNKNVIRPKTSSSLPNSTRQTQKKPKRPFSSHNSSTRIFIEIPPAMLNKDLQLGNLVIRNIKRNGTDKFHISTT